MDILFWAVTVVVAALIAFVIVGALRARKRVDPTDVSLDPALVAKVRGLYRGGDKLAAVKALREATGLGLADAVRIVDRLGAPARPTTKASPPGGDGKVAPVSSSIGPDHQDQLRSLVAAGQQVEAVKMVRTLTGMGLEDAKDYVDRLPPR